MGVPGEVVVIRLNVTGVPGFGIMGFGWQNGVRVIWNMAFGM